MSSSSIIDGKFSNTQIKNKIIANIDSNIQVSEKIISKRIHSPQFPKSYQIPMFNANVTTRLISFKNSAKQGSEKPSFQLSGSDSNTQCFNNSKRSDIGTKSTLRNGHNMSQQYQKFKINLAKSKQKQTISPNLDNRKYK